MSIPYRKPIYNNGDIIGDIEVIEYLYTVASGVNYYNCKCHACGKIFLAREQDIMNNVITTCQHNRIYTKAIINKDIKYGELQIIDISHSSVDRFGRIKLFVECQCSCGKRVIVNKSELGGSTLSCGHIGKEARKNACTTHHMTGTRFYRIWSDIINRCTKPLNTSYHNYGARGITVDPKWFKFEGFYEDMYEDYCRRAKEEGGEQYISIDRKDVNGNYCKENCQWSTVEEQCNNKRTNRKVQIGNNTYSLKQAYDLYAHPALEYVTVMARLNAGIDPIIALALPQTPYLLHKNDKFEEKMDLINKHYVPIKIINVDHRNLFNKELEELEKKNPWRNGLTDEKIKE